MYISFASLMFILHGFLFTKSNRSVKLNRLAKRKTTRSILAPVDRGFERLPILILDGEQDCGVKFLAMLSKQDEQVVYEALLTSPGMSDTVKIDLRVPRRNVLLLGKLIERGIAVQGEKDEGGVLGTLDVTTASELRGIAMDMLDKGGLAAMNDKLNSLYGR